MKNKNMDKEDNLSSDLLLDEDFSDEGLLSDDILKKPSVLDTDSKKDPSQIFESRQKSVSSISISICTLEGDIFSEKNVTGVTLPVYHGSYTILNNHMPFIAQIKEGVVKIVKKGDQSTQVFRIRTSEGFAKFENNHTELLVTKAKLIKE